MLRRLWSWGLGLLVLVGGSAFAQAAEPHWIWLDEASKAADRPAGKAWFRAEFKADQPSTGAVIVASDSPFTLWVNGQKIGSRPGDKPHRFSLSGIVERGTNVFALEVNHEKGPAGLYVEGEIRGQSGAKIPCVSSSEWKGTGTAPKGNAWQNPGFDAAGWKFVKDLGRHADSPWKSSITIVSGELDRFDVPDGFTVTRVAEPKLAGSLVAMTWGNRGRLLVSREQEYVYSLIDDNGDGKYDRAVEFSKEFHSCQGMCQVGDDLYAVGAKGRGASTVVGVYRLRDANHDDVADSVELLTAHKGAMAEHGPHAIVLGPDGWLYHCLGNHAWVKEQPQPTTPVRGYTEGYILDPRFEDAGGHAVGIKAPGGTIWRLSPDGKKWWLETDGFRNEYDIAFSQRGNLFSFDSDMEWDVGLAWYRPVRVNFCPPGAELGWRSGAATWPDYYFDSLPAAINVGRGSPTGVLFYDHKQFPEQYRGTFLCCDWSMGRILSCSLAPSGAAYTGKFESLVTGNPLNVSDIEVDRDGSLLFCTGGRKTEGGVYRLSYAASGARVTAAQKPTEPETIRELIELPQPQSAWYREAAAALKLKLGAAWQSELLEVLKSGDADSKIRALTILSQLGPKPATSTLIAMTNDSSYQVRQFATWLLGEHRSPPVAAALSKLLDDPNEIVRRRACEAFVRSGLEGPANKLVGLLGHSDRWLRFAARVALERVPAAKWKTPPQDQKAQLNWLLGRQRAVPGEFTLQLALPIVLHTLQSEAQPGRESLDAIRMAQLAFLSSKPTAADASAVQSLTNLLLLQFKKLQTQITMTSEYGLGLRQESSKLLAHLQAPGAVPLFVSAMETASTPAEQAHYAVCLSRLKSGWSADDRARLVRWYEKTSGWEGGNSLQGYLKNILSGVSYEEHGVATKVPGCLEQFDPAERKKYLLSWKQNPQTARVIVSASNPDQIADYVEVINRLISEVESAGGSDASQQEMVVQIVDALGRSSSPSAQAILRKLFDSHADLQNQIARSIAKHPTKENVPYLQKALRGGDSTAVQVSLDALGSADFKPTTADDYRQVLLSGLKLGNFGGVAAIRLLTKWTGVKPPADTEKDARKALAFYQKWYAEKFPDALPAELPPATTANAKFTFQQILDYLDHDPRGKQGDIGRGKALFTKVNCVKCHKFGAEGSGVGPDLTSVRRRFQRKEIVESILYPSQVVSDQYRTISVETHKGLQHSGLKLSGGEKLTLLLSDGSKMEIPGTDIFSQTPSKVSVMPEGLIKELSLQEIADLFAYLETSKNAPETPATPPTGQKTAAAGK